MAASPTDGPVGSSQGTPRRPRGCHSLSKLVSATGARLTVTERGDDQSTSILCTANTSTVTFTTGENGTLTYKSDDEAGGTPHARLTKTGGWRVG